jgi:pSer/pThr/pTyr-binding forkhead associated (FHA) protein
LPEVLQMCCLSRRSGQITFRSGESFGFLYLQHGRLLHAICGAVEGDDAVYRMLAWSPGTFSIEEDILPRETTITLSWEQLLLEGAHRCDQGIDHTPRKTSGPIVTNLPPTSTRSTKGSLPKVTLILPDERPLVCPLEVEYTHVGRASGNEIPLADPSVSNRHCILILNGSDVIVRDLNSSNGTLLNGQRISEAVLQPGDLIQVGVVQMKFEPGIRRPKLTQTMPNGYTKTNKVLPQTPPSRTMKLPETKKSVPLPAIVEDDSVFVKGQSAISYHNLPKAEEPVKRHPLLLFVFAAVIILMLLGAGYYFFFLIPR